VEGAVRGPLFDGLKLIETLRWEPGAGFVRLDAHLARMRRGAEALGIACAPGALERALAGIAGEEPLRVRLTLGRDGTAAATTAPLAAGKPVWTLAIAAPRLRSDDPWLRLKTTERRLYDATRAALPDGVDEVVFLNERGEACEGTITSLFADLGAGCVTPPLACGLLPGVLRAELLATGACREALLSEADLRRARLYVGNSLRGLIPARLPPRA
jgi:4-amino-4-deoxychorismate lyase